MPRLQPGGGTLVGTLMFDRGDTGPFKTYLAHASHGPGGESLVKVSNTIDMAWRGDQGIGDVPSGFPTAGPPTMPGPKPGRADARCRGRCPADSAARAGRSGRGDRCRARPPASRGDRGGPDVLVGSVLRTIFDRGDGPRMVRMADPTKATSRPGQPVDLAVEGEDVQLARRGPRRRRRCSAWASACRSISSP